MKQRDLHPSSICFILLLYNLFSTDIDECSQGEDNCDQLCTNTDGSFACGCSPGYTLDADGISCSGKSIDKC